MKLEPGSTERFFASDWRRLKRMRPRSRSASAKFPQYYAIETKVLKLLGGRTASQSYALPSSARTGHGSA
jgi:hypothetical protein